MGDQTMTAERAGINVLMEAAHPLLEIACRLKLREFEEAIEPLRERLCAMMDAFDEAVRSTGIGERTRIAARYCLCTFVDEIVAATPSGGGGAWASRSLLIVFHQEASGGERFFSMLQSLSRDAAAHLDLLELIYVMLALGMEGRYRLLDDGRFQLETVRAELRRLVLGERGALPAWPGAADDGATLWRGRRRWRLPNLLVVGSLAALILFVAGLEVSLHEQAQPVIATLARLRVAFAPASITASASAPAPAAGAPESELARTLTTRLAADLDAHRISIDGTPARAVVTVGSDGLFASGSATVLASRAAVLRRIGAALRDLDARIVVVGHTDDEPPSPGKRSNWQLSLARAAAVANLLREEAGGAERFLAQGRGASEPVAPNDTPANRARNRRVVVTVVAGDDSL